MNSNDTKSKFHRQGYGEAGFSIIEMLVVCVIIFTVAAIALIQMGPSLATSRSDAAMRQVLDQIRQAREYAIENRRYVALSFQTVGSQAQVVITQKNSQTANAGVDVVLSTLPIESPVQFCVCSMPDTPDGFGNGGAIYFGGLSNGPATGMWFQSDGELVNAATLLPINGTVFLGVSGQSTAGRAVTVLGTTGRVRAYRSTGAAWFSF